MIPKSLYMTKTSYPQNDGCHHNGDFQSILTCTIWPVSSDTFAFVSQDAATPHRRSWCQQSVPVPAVLSLKSLSGKPRNNKCQGFEEASSQHSGASRRCTKQKQLELELELLDEERKLQEEENARKREYLRRRHAILLEIASDSASVAEVEGNALNDRVDEMRFGNPEVIVQNLMDKIITTPAPKADKLDTIVEYALAVQNLCATIEACQLDKYSYNVALLRELVNKLPSAIKLDWDAVAAADSKVTEELNSLSRQRAQVMSKVNRIYNAVKDAELGLPQLKVEAKKAAYAEFSGFHSQIIAIVPEEQLDEQEVKYVRFERLYDWTSAQIESRIIKCDQAKPPQVILQQQPLKAPIPTFDGEYTSWPKFKAMFVDVMAQSRDSDAVKLYHLDKALVGAAAGILDAKTINDGNYTQAWNILTERFENTRVIVETHIRGLLSFKKMTSEASIELRSLLDVCTKNIDSLEYLGQQMSGVSELIVVYLLTATLDKSTRKHWEQSLASGELPTYKKTINFLKSHCQMLERCEAANQQSVARTNPAPKQTTPIPKNYSPTHTATSNEAEMTERCDFCNGTHFNYQCNKLNTFAYNEKMEKVRAAGVCFNCLRKGHRSINCPSTKCCRKCQKRHHTQLHDDEAYQKQESRTILKEELMPTTTSSKTNDSSVSTAFACNHGRSSHTVLLQTAVVLVKNQHDELLPCRVLLDSGSQVNFITEKMANTLGIQRQPAYVPIAGINDLRTTARHRTSLEIRSRCSDFRTKLDCLITKQVTGTIPSRNIDVTRWNIPSYIQLADPSFFRPGGIDMLIGAEIFFKLMKPNLITIDDRLPELQESQLGWLVAGAIQSDTPSNDLRFAQVASIQNVEDWMHKFWEIEEVPNASSNSTDEQRCEEHFAATHFRDNDGRFVVRLPLKENAHQLESCRSLALKRFYMLENRLQHNPELGTQYVDFIREYQDLGHCREVNEANDDPKRPGYYLPHHAVLRPNNSTTKCRVVFDASAKASESSLSLNDVLLVGPVVQSELYAIMLRFRTYSFVFTADIAKMYRQIRLHPDDTHYLRIFWRESPSERLKVLELTTVTYGTASAPYQATKSLVQLADDEGKEFPVAAEIIKNDCHVDDILSGANTLDDALEAQRQLTTMLGKAGFPIHKWCSNSDKFLESIPNQDRQTPKPLEDCDINQAIKVLGLLWDPTSDELLLAGDIHPVIHSNRPWTKRRIYSEFSNFGATSKIGIILQLAIVLAKLLVQQLWRNKQDWDNPVDDIISQQWIELRQSLHLLKQFSIPRRASIDGAVQFELHGFADASTKAYGACLYIRSINPDGTATSRLLTSKSKVAPLHDMTIPRKELCAALLLARLIDKVTSTINIRFQQIALWSDSQIVLAWLQKHPSQLEIFVRNRTAEIRRLTGSYQ
ncbi:uncharacterized protein LOC134206681 [Armigeres subalbatus]|uniref:uncharacterized protein LOC134206681 n=1 Tax=Armigeres subalbatus TaxID=124917 RepID=UPI002ED10A7D